MHTIQNIVQAVDQGGIGFHAKRDLAGYSFFFFPWFSHA